MAMTYRVNITYAMQSCELLCGENAKLLKIFSVAYRNLTSIAMDRNRSSLASKIYTLILAFERSAETISYIDKEWTKKYDMVILREGYLGQGVYLTWEYA